MKILTVSPPISLKSPSSYNIITRATTQNLFNNSLDNIIKKTTKQISRRIQDIIFIIGRIINEYKDHYSSKIYKNNNTQNNLEMLEIIKYDVYQLFMEEYHTENQDHVIYQLDKVIKMLKIAFKAAKIGQNINLSQIYNQLQQKIRKRPINIKQLSKQPHKRSNITNIDKQIEQKIKNDNGLQDINQTINKSKILINQLSVKNNPNLNINILNNKNKIKNLELKNKIIQTVENYQNKPSVVQELLYSNKIQGKGVFDGDNKHLYLNIVQEMYRSNSSKDKIRKHKKNCIELEYYNAQQQLDEQSLQPFKKSNKKSKLQLQNQLNQQLIRNIVINTNKPSPNKNDNINEQHVRVKSKNEKINKQLKKCYIDQLKQIDEDLDQRRNKMEKNQDFEDEIQENIDGNVNNKNNNYQIFKNHPIQEIRQQSLEQQQQTNSSLQKLQKQIGQDIQNMRNAYHTKINKNIKSQKQLSIDFISYQQKLPKKYQFDNNNNNNFNINNKYQGVDILDNNLASGLYSFRPSQFSTNQALINQNGNVDNDSRGINNEVDMPTEQEEQQQKEKISSQDEKINHKDYGLPISQYRIAKILNPISKRINFSPIVISQIPYQNQLRQNNNQAQIDNRFNKQRKERSQVIDKIMECLTQKNDYHRYKFLCDRYPQYGKNQRNDQMEKPYRFDQAGNKILRDSKIWRSPGKNLLQIQKFKSLNTPLFNSRCCCKLNQSKRRNHIGCILDQNQTLLKCRSAGTLATMNSFSCGGDKCKTNHSNKYHYQNNCSQEQQELSQQNQLKQLIQQNSCIIKQKYWDPIKKLRKNIEEDVKKIDVEKKCQCSQKQKQKQKQKQQQQQQQQQQQNQKQIE